jgi:hypothetical protein
MTAGEPRIDDDELWAAVEATVRDTLLPDLSDEWARSAAVQLIGIARYARHRGSDPTGDRSQELAEALDELSTDGNEIVAAVWPDAGLTANAAVARCLAAAVTRSDAVAATVTERLRPIVIDQLEDDLENTAPLIDFFRGRLPDA